MELPCVRFCFFFIGAVAAAQPMQFKVDTLTLQDGQEVRFEGLEIGTEKITAQKLIGQSQHFNVYAGEPESVFDQDSRWFRYQLFVRDRADTRDAFQFELKAIPVGQFIDQVRDLNFQIDFGTTSDRGSLRLPVHSLAGQEFLVWKPDRELFDVHLNGEQQLPLTVHNLLPDMSVEVKTITAHYGDPTLWSGHPLVEMTNSDATLMVNEGREALLSHLTVRANPWSVVSSTFFSKSNQAHDKIQVDIRYAAQSGGRDRDLEFGLPIRFVPTLPQLLLALVTGSALGAGLRHTDKGKRATSKSWWKIWFTACLAACVVELVGMALIYWGSKFVVLTLELDPFHIPQVILISALVAWQGLDRIAIGRKLVGKEST